MKNYVREFLIEALRIDWTESVRATAWVFIGLWCRGFFGFAFSVILAFRIGVLFDLPWAVEVGAADILRRLESLDPEMLHGLKMIGVFGAVQYTAVALVFGSPMAGCVRYRGQDETGGLVGETEEEN